MAGYVICITGGKGGVGKSQVAANLAFGFAIEARMKTLLLDFDQKASGDQNFITGLKSKKNLKELSEFSGAIDPRTMHQFVAQHQSGVSYIGMPQDPGVSRNINPEGLGRFLKSVSSMYPLTIIDVGAELNDLAMKALEFATAIFVIAPPDILALNQTKRFYSELVTMLYPKEMILLILNQYQKGHPVTPDVVGKSIGKPVFAAIPKDDANCIQALNVKKPIMQVARTGPFGKALPILLERLCKKMF